MRNTRNKICIITASLLVSSALAGCSAVSEYTDPINPFHKKEETIPGQRHELFSNQDPLSGVTAKVAQVGSASGGQVWPQSGGPATNDAGNLAISISGQRGWRVSVGNAGSGWRSDGVRMSARPVSDGSRVYAYKQNGDVVALTTSGGKAWETSVRPEGDKDVSVGGGVAVVGGRVYAATGYGELVSLDAVTGKVVWRAKLGTPARSAPAIGDGVAVVVTQDNMAHAIKIADGTEAWTYQGISEMASVLSAVSPAISGDTVVVPFSSGEIMALDLKTGDAKWTEAVSRSFRTLAVSGLSDVSASPVVDNGVVYAAGVAGRTIAASLKTGETLWQQNVGSVHTPVVSGNALFMITLDDHMVALDRTTGDPLWATTLPKTTKKKHYRNWAGPVLANGTLVAMSNDGRIALVDATSGKIRSTSDIGVDVLVTPIVAAGRMVVVDGDGNVVGIN